MSRRADDGRAELDARLQPPVGVAKHLERARPARRPRSTTGAAAPRSRPAAPSASAAGSAGTARAAATGSQHSSCASRVRDAASSRSSGAAVASRSGSRSAIVLDDDLAGQRHHARLLEALVGHERALADGREHAQPTLELERRHQLERRQRVAVELRAPVAAHDRRAADRAPTKARSAGPSSGAPAELGARACRVERERARPAQATYAPSTLATRSGAPRWSRIARL